MGRDYCVISNILDIEDDSYMTDAKEMAETKHENKSEKNTQSPLEPLRSIHTRSFAEILNQLGVSLVVSTYQAHRAIVVRSEMQTQRTEQTEEAYPAVNTHFKVFDKPMGIAASDNKLAIGSAYQIWEFRNVPAVTAKLEPPEKHDACYVVRDRHTTGYIDIHEMSYIKDELWFVNTRFSCLCTFDKDHSFVPRWRPPFVSAYDTSDRCHLNGLAVRDGKPYYVTALGETNKASGWRENKVNGGLLMDATTNEIMTRGLSMPHSPRWYRGKLWILESGVGRLATVDVATGELTTVAHLPGFVRGISFCGPIAFIGLSQVRESAIFSGLEIIDKYPERICGVWAVNIETGQVLGFLKFEGDVREIFAVSVLPNTRFPELVNDDVDLLKEVFVLPDEALAEVEITTMSKEDREKAVAAKQKEKAERENPATVESPMTSAEMMMMQTVQVEDRAAVRLS